MQEQAMSLIVRGAVDKFVYGALSKPHEPLRIIAAIGNYADAAYFMERNQQEPLLLPLTLLVVTLTSFFHSTMTHACGISTVWSFLYGYQQQHTDLDHWMYWVPCALMIVPWPYLDTHLYKRTGFHLWPWPEEFAGIAIGAHASFALFGFWLRRLQDGRV
jgi:hypothetical protein